jgi:mono/diheme cytochrome c family protein
MSKAISPCRRGTLRALVGAPLLLVALAACEMGTDTGGFTPITHRERQPLPAAAKPDPPRVVAGAAGGAAPAAVPVLAAADLPPGVTQAMVEDGERLYGTVCFACHGPAGTGTPAGPALNDPNWVAIDGSFDQILNVIHAGVPRPVQYPGAMPPMGGGNFTDEQVRAISAYVYALSRAGAS